MTVSVHFSILIPNWAPDLNWNQRQNCKEENHSEGMDRTAGSCDTLLYSLSNVPALTHLTLVISASDSSLLAGCAFHHSSAWHGVRWQKHFFSFSINWLTYLIAPFITRITQYTCCSCYYVIITNCIKMEKQRNPKFATSLWSQYSCIVFSLCCVLPFTIIS